MKRIIFGIFAHPDDEAFGPSGALLESVKNGAELHLITLTSGQAGTNLDDVADLGALRRTEWQNAADLIGASSTHMLAFQDGQIGNSQMLEAVEQIEQIVASVLETVKDDDEVEFITLDMNGLTGHIDHIAAARAASLVFFRHQKTDARFTKIKYYCLTDHDYPVPTTEWLYMDAGRSSDEIDEIIDARQYREEILTIMRAHHSQRDDTKAIIDRLGDRLGINNFIVR